MFLKTETIPEAGPEPPQPEPTVQPETSEPEPGAEPSGSSTEQGETSQEGQVAAQVQKPGKNINIPGRGEQHNLGLAA